MKNINKNLIFFSFILLTFLAINSLPNKANAYYYVGWVNGNYIGCETDLDKNGAFVGCGNVNNTQTNNTLSNPIPNIYSINPTSVSKNKTTPTTITVTGSNFIQGSIVRFNGFDLPTTYVSSKTLKFELNSSNLSNTGNFSIVVANKGPGGGISNAISFNVNNNPITTGSVSKGVNPNAETNAKNSLTGSTYDENATYDLSANALFATNGFMPTTFLQWVFVFILILFIIALFRKLYVSDKYKATPLKHA